MVARAVAEVEPAGACNRQNADALSSDPLWNRLAAFSFDEPSDPYPFSARLAREQGWNAETAQRALNEYRRFLYLTCVAGHTVCPSEEVDQVWHMHLTFTRSYWQALCQQTLGRALHHEPTRGGPEETRKHWRMYCDTLASYRRIFGEPPPRDIWPAAMDRFSADQHTIAVRPDQFWILKKPRWWTACRSSWRVRWGYFTLPPLVAGLGPLDWTGPRFLTFFLALYLCLLLIGVIVRIWSWPRREPTDEVTLEPLEWAQLAHGGSTAVLAALAGLVHEGAVETECPTSRVLKAKQPSKTIFSLGGAESEATDSVSRSLLNRLQDGPATLQELEQSVQQELAKMEDTFLEQGLLNSPAESAFARYLPASLMAGLLLLGVTKIGIGIARDKPVGLLVAESLLVLVTGLVFCTRPRLSKLGKRALAAQRSLYTDLRETASAEDASRTTVMMAAALFGVGALSATRFADLSETWKSFHAGSTGSGCSSGCGGGGDGGGCGGGGCGGCGGGD